MTPNVALSQNLLPGLESPHSWDIPLMLSEPAEHINRRLHDLLHLSWSLWESVVLHLMIMYLEWKAGRTETSKEHLEEVEKILLIAESSELQSELASRNKIAVQHVLQASYVGLHQDTNESYSLQPFYELDRKQQAAIWGIRSSCLFYLGAKGYYASKESARWAAELAPEEAEWRRLMLGPFNAEKALALERTPVTVLDAALGAALRNEGPLATELLREALTEWGKSSYVQLRCAALSAASRTFGDDNPAKDVDLALKCSEEALILAPHCVLAHIVRRSIEPQHNDPQIEQCHSTYGCTIETALSKLTYCWGLDWLVRRIHYLPL